MGIEITIVHGKNSSVVCIPEDELPLMDVTKLKKFIDPLFHTPAATQKLLFRGKELKDGTQLDLTKLPAKPKMMLLSRAPATSNKVTQPKYDTFHEEIIPIAAPPPAQVLPVIDLVDGEYLIEVVRGKERYRFAIDPIKQIHDVKVHLEQWCHVPAKFQKLLHKGKYPDNSIVLSTLSTKPSIIFMLLFQEQQHIHNEVNQSIVDMQEQLIAYQTAFSRLQSQVARNFFDVTDLTLQVRHLLDSIEILQSNADIASDSAPSSKDLRALIADTATLHDGLSKLHNDLTTRRS